MGLRNKTRFAGQRRRVLRGMRLVPRLKSDSINMSLFAPQRCFNPDHPEWLDRPGVNPDWVREELRAMERANRGLGGHQLVLRYLRRLLSEGSNSALSVLDLGTGSADVPRAIVAWARRMELPVTVVAVDANPVVLATARANCRDWPEIRLEHQDLRSLPYPNESFDVVLCSLTLHHLGRPDAIGLLKRMHDLARVGYLLNDLRRNWGAIWTTELLARTVLRSPILRNDAPQSCRAAFTVAELREMARQAGLPRFQIHRHHAMFRMVLFGKK
jgi:SAM-dependent methyltransferase